ncbi:MAG: radical SAM protein [bacterium]|nr:radical SAM protein [bacterium]
MNFDTKRISLAFNLGAEHVVFRLKTNAVSVTVDTFSVYTFERTGRLYGAFVDGLNYRRGMDGRVIEKGREGEAHRVQRFLNEDEATDFMEKIRGRMARFGEALRQGFYEDLRAGSPDAVEVATGWLDRIAAWDSEAYERDRVQFREVYRPISILPPDQYMALVVQATEGCPWNVCTFCDFYRDRPFRIKSPEELRQHIAGIRALVGEGMTLRRSVFLGDANALTVPWKRLVQTFRVVREMLPELVANGVYGFTDTFGATHRTQQEVRTLASMGLRRVYIGLETGHDALLALVEKQGRAAEGVEAVRRLKAEGVQVGVIVLLGLGGVRYADAHVRDTVLALSAMALVPRGCGLFFANGGTAGSGICEANGSVGDSGSGGGRNGGSDGADSVRSAVHWAWSETGDL